MRFVGTIRTLIVGVAVGLAALFTVGGVDSADKPPAAKPANEYATVARPLIQKYCLQCHSTIGGRVNPHGPDFDARKMQQRNPSLCAVCHIGTPR